MKKNKIHTLALDAVMIAFYVVLNTLAEFTIGGDVKITLGPLPVIIIAFLFGSLHSAIVAGVGELISQIIGFGITWTTPLWIIPPVARAIVICILLAFIRKYKKYSDSSSFKYYEYFFILLISGFITTMLNTGVIALDAVINNYYSYAYVFGKLFIRLASMLASTVVYTFTAKAVNDKLSKVYKYN